MYGNKFVMRFDAKANRETGVFTMNGFGMKKDLNQANNSAVRLIKN